MSPQNQQVATKRRLPKASDYLAGELRAHILGNALQPGDPLSSEAELIAEYGLSRGSVREALRLLEAEGLIDIRRGPKGGIQVVHPDAGHIARSLALLFTIQQSTLRDFFQLRLAVEPQVAADAARDATPTDKAAILAMARTGMDDPEQPSDFHGELGRCAGNSIFSVLLAALHQVLEWHLRVETIGPQDVEATIDAHHRIAQAIHDGDPARAEMLMRKHLEAFRDLLAQHGRLDQPIVPRSSWRQAGPDWS